MRETNIIDSILMTLSGAFGLSQIESVLGILILCLDIVWILTKFGISIYDKIKNKDTLGALSDIKELQKDLEEFKEKNTKKEDD